MEIIIIILGIILDRVTKIWASSSLTNSSVEVIPNFFKLEYLENRGAAFGILQNKQWFLIVFTSLILVFVAYFLIRYRKQNHKIINISLSMIIAGALGNLFDRIVYKYVIDFICVHYKDIYYFPTFNVADMFVVIGTFLLAIYIIKDGK
ncbi:signal peptidase II [Hathewaya limosa]|uniref:Lipoprotein signal peptidase n=1 Tax=Hathewaya limosa TaxID=1536 RepID=A0ABU0JRW1_HATLI|nr:signal peptidase II [Hathewaya limosa]AWZ48244.1 signal peptidase II [Clostridiaceae bacterium 14S0207]MDQ0479824.1 signal peptidase II [Hathewaya limosa]